jgi:thiosulfate/3-mercaptopyruvate sulfurtransferase
VTSPLISVSELRAALAGPTPPVVLDASLVLHHPEFDGDYRRDNGHPRWLAGHIPGSQHVDVSTQFSDERSVLHYAHPEPQAIADELARIGIGRDTPVVVYDTTGTLWAARLWYLLRWINVDARVLDGGFGAWSHSNAPVATGDETPPVAVSTWEAVAGRNPWITKEELVHRSSDDARPLVCGLPGGSFSGASPTRYSRRGHIPGSVSVSSRDLFASDGTVVNSAQIDESYRAAGVELGPDAAEVLLYCGGGISAAGNALTLAHIGVTAVRIYDGSLEEWSADPSLALDVD